MTALAWIAGVFALLLLLGVVYQAIGVARDARRFPPPGRMIAAAGSRFHVQVQNGGAPGPVVLLEAAIAATSLSWAHVQPAVAKFAPVLSYDRAGLGWSESRREPRTAQQCAEELHAVLEASEREFGVRPPYVLVGHSFGGCVVRLYAAQHPGRVAGLVLVDALHPTEWLNPGRERRRMLRGAVFFSRVGGLLARVGVVRFCTALLVRGQTWFPKLFVGSMGAGVSGMAGRIVGEIRKLPQEVHAVVRAHWCRARSFAAMASHVAAIPESSEQTLHSGPYGDLPLVVLSGGHLPPRMVELNEEVARLSTVGRHVHVETSGHWVQLDAPELVAQSVREVVEQVRESAATSR